MDFVRMILGWRAMGRVWVWFNHVYIVIFALSFALAMIFDVFLNHVSQKKSDRAEESAFIWIRKGRATSQHFSRNKVKHWVPRQEDLFNIVQHWMQIVQHCSSIHLWFDQFWVAQLRSLNLFKSCREVLADALQCIGSVRGTKFAAKPFRGANWAAWVGTSLEGVSKLFHHFIIFLKMFSLLNSWNTWEP